MTEEKTYCDRCGKEIKYGFITKYRLYRTNGSKVDLCYKCCKALALFMKDKCDSDTDSD